MTDSTFPATKSLQTFQTSDGRVHQYYSLAALQAEGFPLLNRLPVVIRILLESVLRNCDGTKVGVWGAMEPKTNVSPTNAFRCLLPRRPSRQNSCACRPPG
ncbi:hypothetical protein FLI86_25295 [Pseudomonas aeruginosa]|nr:hypothetical protein FLI86_25295 [Pseudomonas aeruginosa]